MHRHVVVTVLACLLLGSVVSAVDSHGALYVGGTIPTLRENTEGRLIPADDLITFMSDKKAGPKADITYASVIELEYGQKAGRRVAVGIMVTPWALFSKKRNHYLTISYKDSDGKEQAGVFEIGKDIVRTTLKVLETRTGKKIQFQDDEARKSIGGGTGK